MKHLTDAFFNKQFALLGEAAPPGPGEDDAPADLDNLPDSDPSQSAKPEEPESDEPPQPESLSPEGTIYLVNIMKKAFVSKPSDDDIAKVNALGDTTEYNANEIATLINTLTKKYADTDIF